MTSREFSDHYQVTHLTVQSRIRAHTKILEELGPLHWGRYASGTRHGSECHLNAAQVGLLIMLLKNTPHVVRIKKDLALKLSVTEESRD